MGGEGSDDREMSRFKWERGKGLEICEEVFSGKGSNEVVEAGEVFGVWIFRVWRGKSI